MSGAHIHLLLTHLPVLGTVFGLLLLLYGLVGKKQDVLKVSLGIFVLAALAAAVVYLTGEGAEEAVEHLAGVSEALIEPHEEAALIALIGAGILGSVALVGLIRFRRSVLPNAFSVVVLVLALVMSGWMAYTANLGGKINHPEIRSADTAAVTTPDVADHESEDDD